MKLTKSQFKQLLKEEITKVFETHGLEQAAQAMATAGAYELPPQAMQRLMRVINQTSVKLTDEETIELANALIGADMLKTAAGAPEEVGLEEIIKEELEALMREPDVTQSDAERIASELYNNHRRTGEEITHDTIGDAAFEHGEPGGEMATQDLEVEIATALKDLGYLMPEDEPVSQKAPMSPAWLRRYPHLAVREKDKKTTKL